MRVLFNIYSILIIILSVFLYEFDVRENILLMLTLYASQLLFFFFVFKNDCGRPIQYLRPFFILLIGCTIVNFQGIIDYGVMGYGNYFEWFNLEKYVNKCLYLAVIGQTSLTLGYVNYKPRFRKYTHGFNFTLTNRKLINILLIIAFCLFIFFIDLNAFLIGDGSKVNDGSAEREVGTFSLYTEVFLTSLLIIYISSVTLRLRVLSVSMTLKRFIKAFGIPFWTVFGLYIFLRMLSGDRGPVIYNIVILFFGYIYASGYKLSLKGAAVLLVCGAFAVTLLGIARQQKTSLSFIEKMTMARKTFNESEKNSVLPITSELAGSGNIAAIAISAAEEKGTIPFGFGKYELSTLILKIPFISRLIITIDPDIKLYKLSSSELFTREVLGDNYSYGLGTSAIGESFIDFYIFGPIFIFFIFGMLYKAVDLCLLDRKIVSPYKYTLFLYLSGYAVYIGRSSFVFVLSGAILTVIIQYLLGLISRKN